jgi:hypothetical protein
VLREAADLLGHRVRGARGIAEPAARERHPDERLGQPPARALVGDDQRRVRARGLERGLELPPREPEIASQRGLEAEIDPLGELGRRERRIARARQRDPDAERGDRRPCARRDPSVLQPIAQRPEHAIGVGGALADVRLDEQRRLRG